MAARAPCNADHVKHHPAVGWLLAPKKKLAILLNLKFPFQIANIAQTLATLVVALWDIPTAEAFNLASTIACRVVLASQLAGTHKVIKLSYL